MPPSIDRSELDASVKPTDDFFAYVNGKWIKENPIPAEESRWGSFLILRKEVDERLKGLLEGLAVDKNATLEENKRKVRDFYLTAMDVEKCNSLGSTPIVGFLARVEAIQNLTDLASAMGYLHRHGVGSWWSPSVEQDEKDTEIMALHLYQGGLSLPDRDYYLNDDEKSREIRKKFLSYIETMPGSPKPDEIIDIETRLAKASMTPVELREPEKLYNKISFEDFIKQTPRIDWASYFKAMEAPLPEYVIVGQPKFFEEVDRLFGELPLDRIKKYLQWHVINDTAGYLTEDLEQKQFDFYARTFSGAKEMKPRWRRVLSVLNSLLDEAMGELYVEKYFNEDAKKKIHALVDHLVVAFRARLERIDWMGAATKEKAFQKLATFTRKLGYPDKWRDISKLQIDTSSYAENYVRACAFEFDRWMRKIGKPVDRAEWITSPQTVNAFYQPTMNEIHFPAAILQSPFFDPNADDAVNFGGIGAVIGHELTHGFDDQGSQFDAQGNLKSWWTDDDRKKFDERTKRLVEQFDQYEPLPGLHVNGKLTLGENIADLGGLLVAYDGLQAILREKNNRESIDGLTPEQRFFINYAISERMDAREEYLRLAVQTDPHSPSPYRVNGPVSNMDEFEKAFGSKPGDALWREPKDRVKIW